MSGKNLYLEVVLGQNLRRLLEPGRLCDEKGNCGWLIVRKRRNRYYVYLDTGQWKEIYLGPLARFQLVPVSLVIRYNGDGKLVLDVEPAPKTPKDIIGVVKALAFIASSLPRIEKVLTKILAKYKMRYESLPGG